ncbi:dipeptidase [Segetibacter aerophilus]|uniref:Dipeptidase n=1 Tax=Segetibacter aerophilus TaxID=670293 RepID=A0A512BGG6_9BACT|nr:dipeptidase [Segetibacter aerophilus]GEO11060.1 dipeptidase [Segetibacter aerophilus]
MKYFFIIVALTYLTLPSSAQEYKKVHSEAIVVDTHNDILTAAFEKHVSFDNDLKGKTHSDLQRLRQGGVDVQIFSVWCDGLKKNPFAYANQQIDTLDAWIARNPSKIMLVRNPNELSAAVSQNKLAALIGVEGGHMIENSLSKLDTLFGRGVRYMTLTWNNSTPWATSAMEETNDTSLHQPKGLSAFGKEVVQHMNKLGMIVDLSHVGERTFWDAINTTTKPVILSHSSVYSLAPVFRNVKDDQIKAVAKNGGVIHLNFFSGFLDSNYMKSFIAFSTKHKAERDSLLRLNPEPFFADNVLSEKYANEVQQMRPPLSLLLDHLNYIVKLVGPDHVSLGSDFDGINSAPQQLDDVTSYPLITKELLARGYSKKDIKKILGGNFMRVFKANMM